MKLDSLLLLMLALLLSACNQPDSTVREGFAGLGQEAAQFTPVVRGKRLEFPEEHGAHNGYRIEWWYVTANLVDEQDRDWGMQWTLFRSALRSGEDEAGWNSPNVWMGHAALTGPYGHRHAETFARGGVGQAGVQAAPFKAWIDNWTLQASGDDANQGIEQLNLQARTSEFQYTLALTSNRPLVLHGDHGYSEKSGQGQASYYYSQPFYEVAGAVEIDGQTYQVTGQAWMDREWSSQPLNADQDGWDWFSLHLDEGYKLMLFQVRQKDGRHYRAGTYVAPDGRSVTLQPQQIQMQELHRTRQQDGRKIPTEWRVQVPDHAVDVTVTAIEPQAWMDTTFPYWEGPVILGGSSSGRGYLEMTGY